MKFLFCSLASPGYLNPAIGVALQLQARGHQVAFVTDIGFSQQLATEGLKRIPRGLDDGPSFQVEHWFRAASVAIQLKHLHYALQQFEPDALVGQQLTLGPLMMGEIKHIPVALIGFSTYLWLPSEPEPNVALTPRAERQNWRHGEMLKWYNEARGFFRLLPSTATCRETPLLGDMLMIRSIPEVHGDVSYLPEKVHLVGHCLWERETPDPDLDSWLDKACATGSHILYMQQGRFFERPSFWPNLIEALSRMSVHAAVSTGRMDQKPGELPANFFARPYVPQGQVLRYAHAMVASANTTAALGALTNGVPSLLIPAGGEQPDVAEQCEIAGVARVVLPEDASPEVLCSTLQAVLEDRKMQDAAAKTAKAFSRIDSLRVAADLLETMAEIQGPVLRSEHCQAWSASV